MLNIQQLCILFYNTCIICIVDIAPAFECPKLTGPNILHQDNQDFIFFSCSVVTSLIPTTVYVSWMLNGIDADNMGESIVNSLDGQAVTKLHEYFLMGNLDKWVGLISESHCLNGIFIYHYQKLYLLLTFL